MCGRALLWVVAAGLLLTASCFPRHPPYTPQPVGTKSAADGLVFIADR